MPSWIAATRATIALHAADHRGLDEAAFDALRDGDRDIDLEPLHVAHRADVVRAFLLARYGGLWVDADCIVMRDLDAVIAPLAHYDLVTYREHEGNVTNSFVYAPAGSAIAASYYARVCALLRSGEPREWRTLGGDALAWALDAHDAPRYCIGCELVQPVAWNDAQRFFDVAPDAEHERRVDADAICYMLSNQEVSAYANERASGPVDADGTFFRHLLRRAAGATAASLPAL
jgi:hypothetical protein